MSTQIVLLFIPLVCLFLAISSLAFLLGVGTTYLFFRRRMLSQKRLELPPTVHIDHAAKDAKATEVRVVVEQSADEISEQWLISLLNSPLLGKAGLYIHNTEHELRLALNLCENSRCRSAQSSEAFRRNAFMSADLGNIDDSTVDEDDALRRYREVSNYALEHALAFEDDSKRFAEHWQQLHNELIALTSELQDLAAELILSTNADDAAGDDCPGIISYYESLSRSLSERATKLKIEAKVLVAYVDTITGLLFEARSLGEFVLLSAHPGGEQ